MYEDDNFPVRLIEPVSDADLPTVPETPDVSEKDDFPVKLIKPVKPVRYNCSYYDGYPEGTPEEK